MKSFFLIRNQSGSITSRSFRTSHRLGILWIAKANMHCQIFLTTLKRENQTDSVKNISI